MAEPRTPDAHERVIERINALRVETPSGGYGNSGTRFKVFAQPGAARTIEEKLADAAVVNRLTGICPSVAIHIPWDRVDDWAALRQVAAGHGVKIGAVNPNLFQDDEYMLGSLCHPSVAVRRRSVDHVLDCIEIARAVGSSIVSLWLADGTNYPGQDNLRARRRRLLECLRQIYSALPPGVRLLLEYKFFEPGFYSTDLPDWGTAYTVCVELGPEAKVRVDTGHHAQGVNVEQIVASLLDRGRLGGFHFNARNYADDDLIVGSSNPFELFRIFNELVAAEDDPGQAVAQCAHEAAYMIDQSHNIEPKVEAMVQSVVNIQIAHANALLVDRPRLLQAQAAGDLLEGNRVLLEAYESDVRPLLAEARARLGLDPEPVSALRRSRYQEHRERARDGRCGKWVPRSLANGKNGRPPGHRPRRRERLDRRGQLRRRASETRGGSSLSKSTGRSGGHVALGRSRLFADMLDGIRAAGQVASVGIDTWGVDFGLLDRTGHLLGNPVHYRDRRTEGMLEEAFSRVPRAEIYARTGIQFLPINTLYQLLALVVAGDPQLVSADRLLTMPALLAYWLTGAAADEFTVATTTTQCFDPRAGAWAWDLLECLAIPSRIFSEVVPSGTDLGRVRSRLGLGSIRVVAPGSHDTASAVAAVPFESRRPAAYISSGTWSLVDLEVRRPVINEAALTANLTNEGGVAGTFRLLKNVKGLWVLQECRRAWADRGSDFPYEELIRRADAARPFVAIIDPDDERLLRPGDMPERIAALSAEQGQTLPPVEATGIGNLLVQAMALGLLGSLGEERELVRRSLAIDRHEPGSTEGWDDACRRFQTAQLSGAERRLA